MPPRAAARPRLPARPWLQWLTLQHSSYLGKKDGIKRIAGCIVYGVQVHSGKRGMVGRLGRLRRRAAAGAGAAARFMAGGAPAELLDVAASNIVVGYGDAVFPATRRGLRGLFPGEQGRLRWGGWRGTAAELAPLVLQRAHRSPSFYPPMQRPRSPSRRR